jgi:hypothetical protein
MKTLKVMAVVAAVAMIPAVAFAQDSAADLNLPSTGKVLGESLDSGLGNLPASYSAAEYNYEGWVRGASIDNGLGRLSATYTAAEYMPNGWVRGEKMDSGLGELTREDVLKFVSAAAGK